MSVLRVDLNINHLMQTHTLTHYTYAHCTLTIPHALTHDCRKSYLQQLDSVVKGTTSSNTNTGSRNFRRLTARSKLRASQALLLLRSQPMLAGAVTHHRLNDLKQNHKFFFCLAELQETRLICSENTLADALGYGTAGGASESSVLADPKPLVRTWIHDECSLVQAVELSRDVLLATRTADTSVWKSLLTAMLRNSHSRSLLQTCLMLTTPTPSSGGSNESSLTDVLPAVVNEEPELYQQLFEQIFS